MLEGEKFVTTFTIAVKLNKTGFLVNLKPNLYNTFHIKNWNNIRQSVTIIKQIQIKMKRNKLR